ncbi:hypothetical protein CLF_103779 [Clonorchis sinensis]|uniref:Uncharacterized protein n=1 Tax=Clonorchis sinensis TaxID=79923 RepID=G7YAD4_CLOSI|nr:hypothetical protein CLF_103779 [Clonorchis sinensis]
MNCTDRPSHGVTSRVALIGYTPYLAVPNSLIIRYLKIHQLAASSVRTLKQVRQQAALPLTLDLLETDVCCVSETRIQDTGTVVEPNTHHSPVASDFAPLATHMLLRQDVQQLISSKVIGLKDPFLTGYPLIITSVPFSGTGKSFSNCQATNTAQALDIRANSGIASNILPVWNIMWHDESSDFKLRQRIWWIRKVKKMEKAQKTGNVRGLLQLVRTTGPWKPPLLATTLSTWNMQTTSSSSSKNRRQKDELTKVNLSFAMRLHPQKQEETVSLRHLAPSADFECTTASEQQQSQPNNDSFIWLELTDSSASDTEMSNCSEHSLVVQQRTRSYFLRNRGPSPRTDSFVRHAARSGAGPMHPTSLTTLTPRSVFKHQKRIYLDVFIVLTLKQACTPDSLRIEVCCLAETRSLDASTVLN